jgi:tRNA (guanine37-N1)-methyltransferase
MIKKQLLHGFDIIGDAAIIKFSGKPTITQKKISAQKLMRDNKHIKRIFQKLGKTEGEERIAKLKWIAGEKTSLVLHKENGCTFYVDLKKVYFSPRLGSERLRIKNLIKKRETVLDMFSGVGPYAIEIAKIAKEVYAIDINKTAIALLNKNTKLNKLNNISVINGDSNKIIKKLNKKFDRIIMNFPVNPRKFIKSALSVAADKCTIHYYFFANTLYGHKKRIGEELSFIRGVLNGDFTLKSNSRDTGEVAPYLSRVCLDLHLKKT